MRTTWALLLCPTWLAVAVGEPTLKFVTEMSIETRYGVELQLISELVMKKRHVVNKSRYIEFS